MAEYRIVSLTPAATEIVAECGLAYHLVGRSHDSDVPARVQKLPALTKPRSAGSNGHGGSELHILKELLCQYDLDLEALRELRPDMVLTQCRCRETETSLETVAKLLSDYIGRPVKLISIAPETIDEVMETIEFVSFELGAPHKGTALVASMARQLERTREKLAVLKDRPKPVVACLENFDPLRTPGTWIPDMVREAGAVDPFAADHYHTRFLTWHQIADVNPDILVMMPYNLTLFESGEAMRSILQDDMFRNLHAYKRKQVYVLDGNRFFHRPGPRLIQSYEILAEIFHPDVFKYRYMGVGWAEYF
ncbi:MAG: ABC transporter substrate-binding protein [Bacteroidetes bacterium]|nr:ABC transporter substrate-binding protein [Bacteroidota bacterium]